MKCQKCNSERIMSINAKCSDLFDAGYQGKYYDGYVIEGMGITDGDGYGDYVTFDYCLDCGQIQGTFPVEVPEQFLTETEEEKG